MIKPMFSTTCSICGGSGVGTIKTSVAEWDSSQIVAHINPSVCRKVLAQREQKIKRAEAE